MSSSTVYKIRNSDVKEALRVLNRSSSAGDLYQALRDLVGNAEEVSE